jgi:hypothetical protein
VQVPLIGVGVSAKSAVLNAQRRLNCYLEPQYDGDKSQLAVFGTPGLVKVLDQGAQVFRGGATEGELLYLGQGNKFLEVNNGFAVTDRNAASRFTTNNGRMAMTSSGTVIVMADGSNAYNYTVATLAFAQIASAMFASPKTVTWQDGYFLASFDETGTNKKRCQISADGITWNALDYRAVESTPGALIRTYAFSGEVHQFTDKGLEFWSYTGDPTFPFQPVRGATLRVGLAARWSVAEGDQCLYFLGRKSSSKGQVAVYELDGHQARSITTPDIANLINAYGTKSDAVGTRSRSTSTRSTCSRFRPPGRRGCTTPTLRGCSVCRCGRSFPRRTVGITRISASRWSMSPTSRTTRRARLYRVDPTVYTDNGVRSRGSWTRATSSRTTTA